MKRQIIFGTLLSAVIATGVAAQQPPASGDPGSRPGTVERLGANDHGDGLSRCRTGWREHCPRRCEPVRWAQCGIRAEQRHDGNDGQGVVAGGRPRSGPGRHRHQRGGGHDL